MSEIEIKDMLKELKGKVDAIAQDVKILLKESERKKISNTFDKVFKKEDI